MLPVMMKSGFSDISQRRGTGNLMMLKGIPENTDSTVSTVAEIFTAYKHKHKQHTIQTQQ